MHYNHALLFPSHVHNFLPSMNITIVQGPSLPVPPLLGGAVEKLWYQLGMQFASYGHKVVHISRLYPSLSPYEYSNGVSYVRVAGYDFSGNLLLNNLFDLLYSLRVLFSLPPAHIVITNTFWLPVLLFLIPFKAGRIVVSVERMPKGQMFLYRHVSLLRCCSSAVAQSLLLQEPVLRPKVIVIPNPLPFSPRISAISSVKRPVILYSGRLHPEKGLELLLKAYYQAYCDGLQGWSLRIVGPSSTIAGGGGNSYLTSLQTSPFAQLHSIEWVGPIFDQEQLFAEYDQASIFVYPSLAERGEAMGLAPLEAMSFGAVPIVSSLTCFLDFIKPGYNGLVFNHRSPTSVSLLSSIMTELASDSDRLMELSRSARLVCETHHPRVIANQMLHAFHDLASTGKS